MKQNKVSITIIKEFEGLSLRVGGWEFSQAKVFILIGEYFERGSMSE